MIIKSNHKMVAVIFFSFAVILRLMLCWVNPPANSFDNHFEPIFMIMNSGEIPSKDACFQCYHPPVFYQISAMIGLIAVYMGKTMPQVIKLLQFVSCFYGILTVGVCYLIICRLPLSGFSRLISFGTVCFLPRHIYMSAMHANDTISYLFVAICVYLLILAADRNFSPSSLCALSIAITITIFTKYTAFIIIPAALTVFFSAFRKRLLVPQKKTVISVTATFILPLSILAAYMFFNFKHYGSALPWNVSIYDPSVHRPLDKAGISFFTFKPWEYIRTPILAPGNLHSFWTLIYSGMWFDTEPYFLRFLGADTAWWKQYYAWYLGSGGFPEASLPLSYLTKMTASGLFIIGLCPLFLVIAGVYECIRGKWNIAAESVMSMFPVLLAFNAAGIIALTVRLPVYNSMKASYFLSSLPAFMVFLGIGIMSFEKYKTLKQSIFMLFLILFSLVTVHFFNIISKLL